MRITNDEYSPIELLAELISVPGRTEEDTHTFRHGERSGHDWLTSKWCDKVDIVLQCYKRYRTHASECQFIRDHGVDIHLRFQHKADTEHHVGFQIKSNQEAERDAKRARGTESMIATLKRQAFEAEHHGAVREWWIVTCFALDRHRKLVSGIASELMSGKPGSMKLRHVTPREAITLLEMPNEEINAICALFLCKDDEVVRSARAELLAFGPSARQIVLETLGPAIEGPQQITHDELLAFEELGERTFLDDLSRLESCGYLQASESGDFTVLPASLPALCALYFEARVRHNCAPEAASRFVSRIVQMMARR